MHSKLKYSFFNSKFSSCSQILQGISEILFQIILRSTEGLSWEPLGILHHPATWSSALVCAGAHAVSCME